MEWNRALAIALLGTTNLACASTVPVVRNIGGAPDYSVSFVSADPEPGSVVTPGQTVSLTITVKYFLQARSTGRVFLIFENEANHVVDPQHHQASQDVGKGSGQVTVSDSITLPTNLRELHVFVPLVPDGMTHTSGELMLIYRARRPT